VGRGVRAQVDQYVEVAVSEVSGNAGLRGLLAREGATLQALVNMGVRFSAYQQQVARSVGGNEELVRVLGALDAKLRGSTYLVGERLTAADFALAGAVADLFTLVLPGSFGRTGAVAEAPAGAADFPSLRRWFLTVVAQDAWAWAVEAARFRRGGLPRVGGQVDVRPDPRLVSKAVDASMAHTADYKKLVADKKAAERAERAAGGVGAGGAAGAAGGGGSGASTASTPTTKAWEERNPYGIQATATQRAENVVAESSEAAEARALAFLASIGFGDLPLHRHEAAKDMATLRDKAGGLGFALCKNLFLKATKPLDEHDTELYFVSALDSAQISHEKLAATLGYPRKTQLRMAKEEVLLENLGAVPGHLSPLHLLNDTALRVNVILDKDLLAQPALGFHPLHNAASLVLTPEQLLEAIARTGHRVRVLEFPRFTPE
jgi:Ala-tRNA(Pro) deacylase